jgi:predicted AAA+ superfamily ATPase
LDIVHHLIEEQKIRFILSGSSARKLKRGGSNLLAGRAFVYFLHPFTSFEFGNLFDLNAVLHWGSLPQITEFQNDTDKTSFLKAYALTYLKEEIQLEQFVRRLDPFRTFLYVAAQCNGMPLNFSSIARDVGSVDHKTVQSYFEILEDTHLGFLLRPYSRSVRKAQSANPKFYFFDTGIKRALENTLDVLLKPQTSAFGDAFEHWVISEIFRMNQILMKDYKLSYFQSRDTGIDLILSKPKMEILVEIKSAGLVDPIKVKRLSSLAKDFPQAKAYWLSTDQTPQFIEGVHCLPWQEGIRKIFE